MLCKGVIMSDSRYEFKSKVVEKKPCSIFMEVKVEPSQTDIELKKVYEAIQQSAKIPGFRVGRVPMDLIKRNYSDVAKEKLIENMIKRTAFSALEKENFAPIDIPVITNIEYEFGQVLKYSFKAECQPEVKVKNYKGIQIKKEKYKVTDANIKASIDVLLDRNAKLVISKSGEVGEKSFVVVSYEGFCNGKAVEKIKAKEYMIDLGAKNTLQGFKDGLLKTKKGETKDIEIEYPIDYINKDLAGKKVIFKTTIEEVKEKELPELNDEFAKDIGLENLDDLKNKIKISLETEENRRQNGEVERQIVDSLLDSNKFDVPQSIVSQQKRYLIEKMSNYMKSQGAGEEFIEKQIESTDKKYLQEAEKNVRLSYILNSICVEEKIEVSDSDLEEAKKKMLDANSARKEDVEIYFKKNKTNILSSIKEDKIFKFLVDNAKITETEKDMPVKE